MEETTIITEKKLIILAMGPTRDDCPYDCEVWSVNTGYRLVAMQNKEKDFAPRVIETLEEKVKTETDPDIVMAIHNTIERFKARLEQPVAHLDKIFLVHKQTIDFDGDPVFDWEEMNRLVDAGVEIWNIHDIPQLKAKHLDLNRLMEKFGTDYFSNSIAYMVAFAIDQSVKSNGTGGWKLKEGGYTHLYMYGCDMHSDDEYKLERGGVEYWMGIGIGAGMKFWVHPESKLARNHSGKPYGVDTEIDWALIDPEGKLGDTIKEPPSTSTYAFPKMTDEEIERVIGDPTLGERTKAHIVSRKSNLTEKDLDNLAQRNR